MPVIAHESFNWGLNFGSITYLLQVAFTSAFIVWVYGEAWRRRCERRSGRRRR